jgi:hypothetical protein
MTTTTEPHWTSFRWTGRTQADAPDLINVLSNAQEAAEQVGPPLFTDEREAAAAAERVALIEELIAWSTDPDGIDRQALEGVNRDGWGIGQ